jgi:hypothetical protein
LRGPRSARIRLLDGSLYTWLGAKALSQFSLMAGISEASLVTGSRRSIYTRLRPGQADGSVDIRLAVMMMRMGHSDEGRRSGLYFAYCAFAGDLWDAAEP